MNKKKAVYLILGLVILAVVIYLYIKYKQSKPFSVTTNQSTATNSTTKAPTASSLPTGASIPSKFPLKYGSKGIEVKKLQAWINAQANLMDGKSYGYVPNIPLLIDGVFGAKTDAALKAISTAKSWSGLYLRASDIYPASEPFYQAYVGNGLTLIEPDFTKNLFGTGLYNSSNPLLTPNLIN